MNQFQSTLTGSAELKDFYPDGMRKEAISEVIKKRRKNIMENQGIPRDDIKDQFNEQIELKP